VTDPKAFTLSSDNHIIRTRVRTAIDGGGTRLTYEDCARWMGRPSHDIRVRQGLRLACKWYESQNQGKVFKSIRNVGYELCTPEEAPELAESGCIRIRKQARKTLQRSKSLATAGPLSDSAQYRMLIASITLSGVSEVVSAAANKRLRARVTSQSEELPSAEIFRVIAGLKS